MGIYLPNMEMPKSCWDCPLLNTSPCACKGYSTALEHTTNRHPDCPLVPVPDHGRLIDVDALGTPGTIEEDTLWRGRIETEVFLASTIYNAATIIPASGGADDE